MLVPPRLENCAGTPMSYTTDKLLMAGIMKNKHRGVIKLILLLFCFARRPSFPCSSNVLHYRAVLQNCLCMCSTSLLPLWELHKSASGRPHMMVMENVHLLGGGTLSASQANIWVRKQRERMNLSTAPIEGTFSKVPLDV